MLPILALLGCWWEIPASGVDSPSDKISSRSVLSFAVSALVWCWIMVCFCIEFSGCILFGVSTAAVDSCLFSPKFWGSRSFLRIFFQLYPLSPSSLRRLRWQDVRSFVLVPKFPWALLIVWYVCTFGLCWFYMYARIFSNFRLGHFYFYVFKIIDNLLFLSILVLNSFLFVLFSSVIFICFYIISMLLQRLRFSFVSSVFVVAYGSFLWWLIWNVL